MANLWELTLPAGYGIPLILLYCFVLINFLVPHLNKHYRTSFYKIAIVIGFVDIFNFISYWLVFKLPGHPLTATFYEGKQDLVILRITCFLSYYLIFVRSYLLILSSANRFTALQIPLKHEKFWNRFGPIFVLVMFLIPLPFSIPTLIGEPRFIFNGEGYTIDYKSKFELWSRLLITAILCGVAGGLTFIFNVLTLFCLFKARKVSILSKNVNIAEHNLILITFYDFIIDMIFIIQKCIVYYAFGSDTVISTSFFVETYKLTPWLVDMLNLSRPVFFLLMAKGIRESFFDVFCRCCPRKNSSFKFVVRKSWVV